MFFKVGDRLDFTEDKEFGSNRILQRRNISVLYLKHFKTIIKYVQALFNMSARFALHCWDSAVDHKLYYSATYEGVLPFPGTYDSGMVGLCNIVFPIFLSMLGPLLPCITVNIFKALQPSSPCSTADYNVPNNTANHDAGRPPAATRHLQIVTKCNTLCVES